MVPTFLMCQSQLDGQEVDEVLNQKSGLLGISGFSSDMREGHERAKLVFDIFESGKRIGH